MTKSTHGGAGRGQGRKEGSVKPESEKVQGVRLWIRLSGEHKDRFERLRASTGLSNADLIKRALQVLDAI